MPTKRGGCIAMQNAIAQNGRLSGVRLLKFAARQRRETNMKLPPAKPLKWAAYGAISGPLIIIWGPALFGLPSAFSMVEVIGGIIAGGGGAYVGALIHNSLRR